MAETKQKWLKTRKIYKIWRKRGMLAIFCFCTFNLSNSFLSNCQLPFCQVVAATAQYLEKEGCPISNYL